MRPHENESPVNPHFLRPELTVFDIVYNPVETKLLRKAREIGAKTVDGLHMLLYQGVVSFMIWTGVNPPIEVMRETLESSIREGLRD
ncbi:MAG: hypothetical protein QXL67_03595 [Candidatus Bathyarchaeia archaeon]